MSSSASRSRSNVSSWLTDFGASYGTTSRSSTPWASSRRWCAAASPRSRSRMASGVAPSSPIVRMPSRPSSLAGLLPDPPQPPDRQGIEERPHAVAGHHEHPVRACSRRRRASPRTSSGPRRPSRSRRPRARRRRGSAPRSRPGRRTASWRPPTSRNASSSEIGSTRGVYDSRTSRNRFEWARYASKSVGRKTASGQRRRARTAGIAERTPYVRAS